MKKKYGLIFALSACAATFAFAGCGGKDDDSSSSSSSSSYVPVASLNILDSVVTMDCFADYQMEVELKELSSVVWSSSDPSILSVDENGLVTSALKQGTATITAQSGDLSDSCEVTVLVKGNPPVFVVENDIIISNGYQYTTSLSVFYNGKDVTEYATLGINAMEGDTVATATLDGADVIIDSKDFGKASFAVHATLFDQLYADTINVEVKDVNLAYVVRGESDGGLIVRPGKDVFTSDILVYDNGEKLSADKFAWTVKDQKIATIGEDGKLIHGKEGKTTISAQYAGQTIVVDVAVVKEHIPVLVEQTGPEKIDLNVTALVDAGSKSRSYATDKSKKVTLNVGGEAETGDFVSAHVGDVAVKTSTLAYKNGVLTVPVKSIDTSLSGETELRFVLETADKVYEYSMSLLLVTKTIKTYDEFKTYISTRFQGDRILGYFELANDIDFGFNGMGEWSTDWNYLNGFRGVLEGNGYAIKNFKPGSYGLTGQVGGGAIIRNLIIDGVFYEGQPDENKAQNAIITRGIGAGAMVENVTIYLLEKSTPEFGGAITQTNGGGLLTFASTGAIFKDITIHAVNEKIYSLFGKQEQASEYDNIKIYNAFVERFHNEVSEIPAGVSIIGMAQFVENAVYSDGAYEVDIQKDAVFNTAKNVFVYKDGKRMQDADLLWTIADDKLVARDASGNLTSLGNGITTVSTTSEGTSVVLRVSATILDRIEKKVNITSEVNLDMSIVIDTAQRTRDYIPSNSATASITVVTDGNNYGALSRVLLDGKMLKLTDATYVGGVLTIPTAVFGNVYGEKTLVVETKTDDAIYAFNVPVIFITKALSTKTDVEEALALRWKGETIVGYFTLANDIDCQGVAMYSENFVDWDDNHGFRGTFDGKGFAFLNYATTVGGISVQMGKGSVVKNVSFDVTNHVNEYFCVVSRESSTTVFENITVRLLNVKAKFVTGLMTGASKTCHYKDIIIDGAGLSLTHIFGYTNSSTSTYENVVINAESVEYYYESVATAPEGVTFNKKEA